MRVTLMLAGAVGALALTAAGEAQAARWCAYDGGATMRCGFKSAQQCRRTIGRGVDCRREVVHSRHPMQVGSAPGQLYPNRPYWSSPYECFMDDGGGRFRPCNASNGGGFP